MHDLQPDAFPTQFLNILSHENVASRAPVFEQYDKQVQGSTYRDAGDGDSGIITPFDNHEYPEEIRKTALTLTTDQNPRQNRIDPYQGAVNAVAEAYCNTVSSGAEPIALSDCLCYGNPEKPDQMRLFVEGCKGVADAANEFGIPIIAGNVSLYNESESGSIPPSPMIAALGLLEDRALALESQVSDSGVELFLLGERKEEFGGSIHYELSGLLGTTVPKPDLGMLRTAAELIRSGAQRGLIKACRDISEGGLATAAVEMTAAGRLGLRLHIPEEANVSEEVFWFSESFGFVIGILPENRTAFLDLCSKMSAGVQLIGSVNNSGTIMIGKHINLPTSRVYEAWTNGLRRSIS